MMDTGAKPFRSPQGAKCLSLRCQALVESTRLADDRVDVVAAPLSRDVTDHEHKAGQVTAEIDTTDPPTPPRGISDNHRVAANALANASRSIVALAVLFLLTPYVIHRLGAEQYGLWVLLASVIGYFELMDCGLATATVKFIGQFEGQGDAASRNRLISTLLATYLVIAMVVVLVAAYVGANLLQWLQVAPEHRTTALIVFSILAARAALSLPLSLFMGVLFGRQQICLVSLVRTGFYVLFGIAAWATLARGGGLIGFAAVHATVSTLEHLTLLGICMACTPRLEIRWRHLDWLLLRQAFAFSGFALLTNLSATALLRTDPILVKMFLPLGMVAVYGVALRIGEQLLSVTKQGLNAVTPLVAQLHGAGDLDRIRSVLLRSVKWSLASLLALAIPAACWSRETLSLWVGPQFEPAAPIVMVLAAAMGFRVIQEAGANVLAMTGRHPLVAWTAIGNAALNIGLSVVLVRHWGVLGVAMGTLLATAVTMLVVVQAACWAHDVRWRELLGSAVAPAAAAGLVQIAVCLGLRHVIQPQTWAALAFVYAAGVGSLLLSFWHIGMQDDERAAVTARIGSARTGRQTATSGQPVAAPATAAPTDGEVS
ncbi:MAG: flippase [Planctomycetales bacterium]|nr:flippase [Planctomycetales bacterium]